MTIRVLILVVLLGACGDSSGNDDPDASSPGGDAGPVADGSTGVDAQVDSGPPPDPGEIVARFEVSGASTCVAPCAVHFDATETLWGGHDFDDALLGLDYTWDFGDPDSGHWTEGARSVGATVHSRNREQGFVAVHVYERPGTYVVNLEVSDGPHRAVADAVTLTITDPDSEFAGSATVCVGATDVPTAGADGCPAGATTVREMDFTVALEDHCQPDTRSVRCLFRGGDSFVASGPANVGSDEPSIIGSFGSGQARVDATGGTVIRLQRQSSGTRIVDLQLVGTRGEGSGAIMTNAGSTSEPNSGGVVSDLLILRTTVEDFNTGIMLRGSSFPAYDPTHWMHERVAIVDSAVLHGSGLGGTDAYLMGNRLAVLGTRLSDKRGGGLGEHTVRIKYARRSIFAHNSLGLIEDDPAYFGCQRRGTGPQGNLVFKMIAGYSVTLPPERQEEGHSREIVFSDNRFSSCRQNVWDLTIGATDSSAQKAAEHVERVVIDSNHFSAAYRETTSGSGQFIHLSNASHIVARNNVFDATGPQISMAAIVAQPNEDQQGEPGYSEPRDIRVHNNTYFDDSPGGESRTFLSVRGEITRVDVSNNLAYVAAADELRFISLGDAVTGTCCGGTCPGSCNVTATAMPFSVSPTRPSIADQFQLQRTASGLDVGSPAEGMVHRDATGHARPMEGAWDVGAFQR